MGGQAGGDVWVRAGGDLVCTAVEVLGCWVPLWDSEEGRVQEAVLVLHVQEGVWLI